MLSAGRGERLRPLTDRVPKPMLEVGGRPLVHYPILMLRRVGVTRIALNVHHLAAEIERGLGSGAQLGVELTYAEEDTVLGTGGALLRLRDFLGQGTFVVANSDTIMSLDLEAMLATHRRSGAVATLAVRRPEHLERYSRLEIDAARRLRRLRLLGGRTPGGFEDHPADLDPAMAATLTTYMYCGLVICEPAVLVEAPKPPPLSLVRHLLAPMVTMGAALYGFVHDGYFRTVDDLESYRALVAEFAAGPPDLDYLRGPAPR